MARELKFAMTVDSAALLQVNPKEFYTKALLANRSSSEFRQVLNIKEKTKIGSLSFGTLLFPAECDWQGGNSTLGAKEMDVCKAQIGSEVCMYEMETSFLADWMNSGSNGDWMPANFASFFFEELGRDVNDKLEVLTWQGDSSVTFDEDDPTTFIGICDGLEKMLCGATIPSGQVIAGATVDASNVIAELTKVYNVIPKEVRQTKADVKWFVSQNIADAYLLAVATQSAEQYTNKEPELKFLGFNLSIGTGMSDNVMTVSLRDNYVFLADMVSDPEDLNVIDMSKTTGDKKWRVRSDFKVGFNYLNDAEWVVYGLDCAS
jgi:hypothetical protein